MEYGTVLLCPGCRQQFSFDPGFYKRLPSIRQHAIYCCDGCRELGPFERRTPEQQAQDMEGWI